MNVIFQGSFMKSVAIIGARASGLISAKVFLDKGFDVTVFEKN